MFVKIALQSIFGENAETPKVAQIGFLIRQYWYTQVHAGTHIHTNVQTRTLTHVHTQIHTYAHNTHKLVFIYGENS